jgi:hypothetical protein
VQEFTFDEKGGKKQKKERTEWLRIWCENTDSELPRIALIGDSITEQTFNVVKRELQGILNVDFLTTSYSILSPAYFTIIEKFMEDSCYDIVYYNYGLHAHDVSADEYENAYRLVLKKLLIHSKVIIGLTTTVLDKNDLGKESERWSDVIIERNIRAQKLANEFNITIDDLYSISKKLGREGKNPDGVHFNEYGIEKIGRSKVDAIKKLI